MANDSSQSTDLRALIEFSDAGVTISCYSGPEISLQIHHAITSLYVEQRVLDALLDAEIDRRLRLLTGE